MSNKIKVSEIYYSLQGEGQYIGIPSVFLKVFGCNMECGGFGMPKGELSTERDKIAENIDQYKDYKDLPMVTTGCDSYASWDERFKHLSPILSVGSIVNKFEELLPDGKFSNDKHLIITGGEPLLNWQKAFPTLLEEIETRNMDLTHLTFETNGTRTLVTELHQYLQSLAVKNKLEVTFSISPKLPMTGGIWRFCIKPDIVASYMRIANNKSHFKFVVSKEEDIEDVNRAINEYRSAGVNIPVYIMPVGGINSVYEMNEKTISDLCMKNGFRFSPRMQMHLNKNNS